jgi:hypothetical protein
MESIMKKILTSIVAASLLLGVNVLAQENKTVDAKKMLEKKVEKPNNIDKNNVGITSGEKADQTDETIIEGNLEDNDFKN